MNVIWDYTIHSPSYITKGAEIYIGVPDANGINKNLRFNKLIVAGVAHVKINDYKIEDQTVYLFEKEVDEASEESMPLMASYKIAMRFCPIEHNGIIRNTLTCPLGNRGSTPVYTNYWAAYAWSVQNDYLEGEEGSVPTP